MCSPAMVLVVHAPVICLVEDLMVACGKRADDTLCLLAPTRRWCCQQPKKKNDGSPFCYLTKQTQQKREALVQQENVVQDNSVVKTKSSNPIQNSNGKIHMQSKAKSFWFINFHQKAKFLHSLEQKQHLINRYRTHLHKSTVPSKWLTFYFSLQQSLSEESQGWS